jgi:dephospho-CoA kinase
LKKLILGLVGERGAGKDTVANHLIEKHGAVSHRYSASMKDCLKLLGWPMTTENLILFSELTRQGSRGFGAAAHPPEIGVLKDCLERLGLPATPANVATLGSLLVCRMHAINGFGEDLYARVIANDCRNDSSPLLIVNGIRRFADVSHLQSLPEYRLLYVTAPAELRWERVRNRGEKEEEKNLSWEQFLATESLPTEVEIPRIGAEADFVIHNDEHSTLDGLYEQVESLLRSSGFPATTRADPQGEF